MTPQIFRIIGLLCCIIAAVLAAAHFMGRPLFGSVYTPLLLVVIGALFLIRGRLTRS